MLYLGFFLAVTSVVNVRLGMTEEEKYEILEKIGMTTFILFDCTQAS